MSFNRSVSSPASYPSSLSYLDLRTRSISAPQHLLSPGARAPDETLVNVVEATPPPGTELCADYTYKGMVYGSQRIERIATIPQMMRLLQVRKDHLSQIPPSTDLEASTIRAELSDIETQLQSCQEALDGLSHIPRETAEKLAEIDANLADIIRTNDRIQVNALSRAISIQKENRTHYREQCKFDWIGSNYVRDCLVECEDLENPDLNIAYNAYLQTCSKIIPAPVNLRRHEVFAGGKNVTIIRTGVISDMRDGYHSLDTLVEAQKPHSNQRRRLLVAADAKRRALFEKEQKATPELVVLHHACENIKSTEALDLAVARRRSYLQHQMLMLVMEHVKTAQQQEPLAHRHTLPIMHLSLLNRTTDVIDKTGWKKSEETFMRDMAQIFKEFDGKTILFDGQGPLVDNRGVIHMPPEFGTTNQQMTLDTYFLNISVQNHKKNDGHQRVINRAFFKKLYETGTRDGDFESLRKKLKKSSDFDTAEAFANTALKHGYFLSIGCLSAKDRTGWLCGRLGVQHVIENSCQLMTAGERKLREEAWSNDIFEGPAFQVCEDCNLRALEPLNVEALKLTELKLAGVSVAKRASQFSKLISMAVNPKSPEQQRRKISPPPRSRRGVELEARRFSQMENTPPRNTFAETTEEEVHSEPMLVEEAPALQQAPKRPSFILQDLKLDRHPRGRTFAPQPASARRVAALTQWFEDLAKANRPQQ